MNQYLAPWRLATLGGGVALLIVGSKVEGAMDWDVGISVLMAVATYVAAPFTAQVLWEGRWRHMPLAAFGTWLAVDGIYAMYWGVVNPVALHYMRDANFYPSLLLYCICGVIWKPYK